MSKSRSSLHVSWWDRLMLGIAPKWGMERLRAKAVVQSLGRHYDAAGGGRRTQNWHRRSSDANVAAQGALVSLRELSRDLHRNNGWAISGVGSIVNNTVGWGITARPLAQSTQVADRAAAVWREWAESPACDYDGRMPFTGLQGLVMQTVVLSGEALIIREAAKVADGLPVPLRLRVIEPDYLDLSKDGYRGDAGPIKQGVEFDGHGRRVAYWLFDEHPGGRTVGTSFVSRRVPASDVLHIYWVDRPGQVRGVAWLAAAIAKLNDFDDYEDAVLMQQKIAACFAAFVSNIDGTRPAIGEEDQDDDALETLEPGHIAYLGPGEQVTFAQPPSSGGPTNFSANNLRRIAAGLCVPYEDVTGDYSQVNFSSARMARLRHWQFVHRWRWSMFIPGFCEGVYRWVMGMAAELEGWPEVPRAKWGAPPLPMLEPDKEGLAYQRLVRGGFMTLGQAIAERGEDPDEQLEEIAEFNRKLDEKKIWLDSDPRRTSGAGLTQERVGAGGGEKPDGGGEEES